MSYSFRKKNGTSYYMYLNFKYGDKEFKVEIDIPFDILVEAIRQYSEAIKDVVLDGTDRAIWNLFSELDALEQLAEEEYVLNRCKELYLKSRYYEDDLEEWTEEYEYDNDIKKEA